MLLDTRPHQVSEFGGLRPEYEHVVGCEGMSMHILLLNYTATSLPVHYLQRERERKGGREREGGLTNGGREEGK